MKKRKVTETVAGDDGTLDLISQLPDSILVRIISLLPWTDEAVRTSVVSKRWQYLWTFVDDLNLLWNPRKRENFLSFVDHLFAQCNSSKIRKFHLVCPDVSSNHIEQWLSYVIKYELEHVVLIPNHFVRLPQLFHTCSSLITLKLFWCTFDEGVAISFRSLKSLKLSRVKLENKGIVQLLSGCPSLETMELANVHVVDRLEVNNSNLKRLTLKEVNLNQGGHHSLEIFAPYLQHLEISGLVTADNWRLVNVASLISVSLTIYYTFSFSYFTWRPIQPLVQDCLKSHVTELTIGTWFAEALFMLQLEGMQLPELNCKCLTVKLCSTVHTLYGVANLLRASPYLETLNIDMQNDAQYCHYNSSYLRKGDDINLKSWISDFAIPSLKSVNIICRGLMCWKEHHLKLIEFSEFLLKNAMVLEKVVIIAKRNHCQKCLGNCVSPYLSRLADKLLGCPRPSSNFRMIFHVSDFKD